MHFVKMHGIGNDYVYLDAVNNPALAERNDLPDLARRISNRHTGAGSDGLILVCKPSAEAIWGGAHVRMRMFNADGSESDMCGNGVRCVAKFAHDRLGLKHTPLRVETGRGVLDIAYKTSGDKLVLALVDMGEPILDAALVPTTIAPTRDKMVVDYTVSAFVGGDDKSWWNQAALDPRLTAVSMGNPHIVFFCRDVARIPLATIGPVLEIAPMFPKRTNAHFVQIEGRRRAIMRTWERGAGITQACGTGACAVLVAAALTGRMDREATLRLPGGELQIRWSPDTNHVLMTGPAEDVFEGDWPDA